MATILLTAVGTALGGPIGGALGALAGQAVDARLFGSGQRREGPRLTELAVQTSSYGTRIPAVFGRMRVAGTVIWATDLQESSEEVGGGKGTAGTTQFSYSVSLAVALSSRPVADVGRIWADGKLLRGVAGDFKSACTFRLHHGHGDQLPDPLIASAEGAGMAPAHRGLAYAVFEDLQLADYGNHIPSLSFELIERDGGVTVAKIAGALGMMVEAGAGTTPLIGYAADADDARGALATLLSLPPDEVSALASDVVLLAPPAAAGAPIAPLGHPELTRAPLSAMPGRLSLRHYDSDADYQAGLQQAERPGGGRRALSLDWPAALDATEAAMLAAGHLASRAAQREALSLDVAAADAPAPGSVVAILGIAASWRVEAVEHDRASARLQCRRHGGTGPGVATAPDRRSVTPADDAPAPTRLALIELPAMTEDAPHRPVVAIAATGATGWRGAALERVAGDARLPLGAIRRRAVVGTVEVPPGPMALPLWDEPARLIVECEAPGMLHDADDAALAAGANLAWCGGEVLQFRSATPLGDGRWALAGLARGLFGTEDGAGAQTAGDDFVLLDRAALMFPDVPLLASGMVLGVEATGLGDMEPVVASLTIVGRALAPPAPVHGRFEPAGDGGLAIGWIRRSRVDRGWVDAVDVPLVEPFERYRVTPLDADGIALTEREVATNTCALAASDLTGVTALRIAQIGGDGISPPLEISLLD